ncbi:bacillopeptidase F [Folsomia candida]|nr:bacillopeptidase F [Folsomia candida]
MFPTIAKVLLLSVVTPIALGLVETPTEKIHFKASTSNDVILSFNPSPNIVIKSISQQSFATRGDKINQLVANLEQNTKTSQQIIHDYLTSNNIAFIPIWITNQISVKNVDLQLLEELSKFEDIIAIEEDLLIPVPQELVADQPTDRIETRRDESVVEWGIQIIRANEARFLINSSGLTHDEVRVGIIDTGIRLTHEAIEDKYYGTYGWFDPYGLTDSPDDGNGHGTHVTGTILGSKGIGVAPFAKWMGCKGCDTSTCAVTALLLCGQYITCPTLPDMSAKNCTLAPHVVNNSWGGGQNVSWYDVVINAWHEVGIIPVFAAGNYGPLCSTVSSPSDRNVISVGATTSTDTIASFSGRGPAIDGGMKPDISGPGDLVLSSTNVSDTSYGLYRGTSMATPHIVGVIAIMKSININLSYEEVKYWLENGVDTTILQSQNIACGGIPDNQFPNPFFGHGRVNAFKSVSPMLLQLSTTTTTTTTTTTPRTTPRNPNTNSGVTLGAAKWLVLLLTGFAFSQVVRTSLSL